MLLTRAENRYMQSVIGIQATVKAKLKLAVKSVADTKHS